MNVSEPIALLRDVLAVAIPAGTAVTLPKDSVVRVMQSLGGSYTVRGDFIMARIAAADADALGFEPGAPSSPSAADAPPAGPVDEEAIWGQIRTCYDPEIPVNIVDLGLVYDCHVEPLPDGGNRVEVKMTLTAPGCGMGPMIASDVETKIRTVPGVTDVSVEVVWDPPWNQAMMTDAAKLELGLI
jgi:probable FeS assembly SUF system protein SufT